MEFINEQTKLLWAIIEKCPTKGRLRIDMIMWHNYVK